METIKCLDHGLVSLIDCMGNDQAIVEAARVSYGPGTKKVSQDRGLIRYLMRNRHTSPFEMVEFKFYCKMPIFVARQWIRHRTANVNEISGRYSVMPEDVYLPSAADISLQSKDNKQGRSNQEVDPALKKMVIDSLKGTYEAQRKGYNQMLEAGLARELARISLPLSQYTEWYWKIDLHNLLHFLKLRLGSHAQKEIRVYAKAISQLISPIIPLTWEAFEDYELGGYRLSSGEVQIIKELLKNAKIENLNSKLSERELKEFKEFFC